MLEELGRVLEPGGLALVKVPNFGSLNRMVMGRHWCGFRHPDHLNYFTPVTLRLLAAIAGFEVELSPTDVLPTDDNMVATLRNTKRPRPITELLPAPHAAAVDVVIFRTSLSSRTRPTVAGIRP